MSIKIFGFSFGSAKQAPVVKTQAEQDFDLAREAERRALARAKEMAIFEAELAKKAEEAEKKQAEEDLALYALEKAVAKVEGVEKVAAKREAKAKLAYQAKMTEINEAKSVNAEKRAALRARLNK